LVNIYCLESNGDHVFLDSEVSLAGGLLEANETFPHAADPVVCLKPWRLGTVDLFFNNPIQESRGHIKLCQTRRGVGCHGQDEPVCMLQSRGRPNRLKGLAQTHRKGLKRKGTERH